MTLHADEITPEMYSSAQSKIAAQTAQIEALRNACQRALPYMLEAVLNQQAREDIAAVRSALAKSAAQGTKEQ